MTIGHTILRTSDLIDEIRLAAETTRRAKRCIIESDQGERLVRHVKERFCTATPIERLVILDLLEHLPPRVAFIAVSELAECTLTGNAYEASAALDIMRKSPMDHRLLKLSVSGTLHRFRAPTRESRAFAPRGAALLAAAIHSMSVAEMDINELWPPYQMIVLAIDNPEQAKCLLFDAIRESLTHRTRILWYYDILPLLRVSSEEADALAAMAGTLSEDWIVNVELIRALMKAAPRAEVGEKLMDKCLLQGDDRMAQCRAAKVICDHYGDLTSVLVWGRNCLESDLDEPIKAEVLDVLIGANISDDDIHTMFDCAMRNAAVNGELSQQALRLLGRVRNLTVEDQRRLVEYARSGDEFISWQAHIALERHR